MILDAVAVERRAEIVGPLEIPRRPGHTVFFDRGDDVPRRLRVLRRDGHEVEAEDLVCLEEHGETFGVGDRAVDGAALKPRDRGRQVEIVGQRATERLEPPGVERGVRQFALGHLRPVPHALAEVIERFRRLPERPVRKLHAGAVVREQAEVAESERIHVELHQIVDRHGVARRLGHLHAVGEEMLPM